MGGVTIEQILAMIRQNLHVSKETEYEVLEEIRTHLEEAVAEARAQGEDEVSALLRAADEFGIEEASVELQEVHSNWESIEAILVCALPVLFAIIMRWLIFAPDGSAVSWSFSRIWPWFGTISIAALLIPVAIFRRWRLALLGWGFFWLLTVIFLLSPSINQW
jgi:hypothetical protein